MQGMVELEEKCVISEHLFKLNKKDQNFKNFFINCHEVNIASDFYLKFWVFFKAQYNTF